MDNLNTDTLVEEKDREELDKLDAGEETVEVEDTEEKPDVPEETEEDKKLREEEEKTENLELLAREEEENNAVADLINNEGDNEGEKEAKQVSANETMLFNSWVLRYNGLTNTIGKATSVIKRKKCRKQRHILLNRIINHALFDPNKPYFKFPNVSPAYYIPYNIAVIGNSPNLLHKKQGAEIDAHACTFRFNYFNIKGFEEYVGTKTSICVAGYPALKGGKPKNHPKINKMNYYYYHKVKKQHIFAFYKNSGQLATIKKAKKKIVPHKNKMYYFKISTNYCNEVLKFYGMKLLTKSAQCGSSVMFHLIDMGLKPDVYGFDTEYSIENYHYYWDMKNKKCKQLSVSHNYNDEFAMPKLLHAKQVITLKTFSPKPKPKSKVKKVKKKVMSGTAKMRLRKKKKARLLRNKKLAKKKAK